MGFMELYNESISTKNAEKAIKLIKTLLERNIGMKMFEYGSEMYKNKFGSFNGIKYFLGSTLRAVRFNWQLQGTSTEIYSIDVWNDAPGDKSVPTITIMTQGISMAQAIPQLAKIIKNPKAGLNIPIGVDGGNITEAKVKWSGMEFPSSGEAAKYLASQGYSVDDIAKAINMAPNMAKYHSNQYLKTVKGVPEKHITSPQDKKSIAAFDAQQYADPDVVFEDLRVFVKLVCDKIQYSLLVTGMPGIGKTYSVTQYLDEFGKKKNTDDGYVVYKGQASPFGLYSAMFNHRRQIIVFDDCDSILKDDVACNILKAGLDSYPVREISWQSKSTFNAKDMDEESILAEIEASGKYPNQFQFRGQIIFISNVHKSKMEQAIISRSIPIDITLRAADVFKRMQSILKNIDPETPLKLKQEVLEYLKEEYSNNDGREANMRTLLQAIKMRRSGHPDWKRLVLSYA